MAICCDYTHHGVVIHNSYVRITQYSGTKKEMRICVTVNATREHDPLAVEYFDMPLSLDAGNPLAQAYAYLKTLPQFARAEDVGNDGVEQANPVIAVPAEMSTSPQPTTAQRSPSLAEQYDAQLKALEARLNARLSAIETILASLDSAPAGQDRVSALEAKVNDILESLRAGAAGRT